MSSGARIGLPAAAVVVLGLAFVLLSPGGDDEPDTATAPTATAPAPARTATAELEPEAVPPPPPEWARIRVQDGAPAGGVQTITVKKGERARIQVSSQDTSDEIHLHGYDLARDLQPGDSARFSFAADAEGIFEIELHGTGTQIGKLVVEP